MKHTILRFALILLSAVAPTAGQQPSVPTPARVDLALTHVTVVDVESGRLHEDRTVLVAGNRITDVAPAGATPIPPGARVVDARGEFVIPGLVDAHVHIFNNVSRRPPNTWAFPLFVANGVTGVREMWTEPASVPSIEQWRREVAGGMLLAPRVLAAAALVDGPRAWFPNMTEVTTPAEGRDVVREAAQAGADFIKVYALLSPQVYAAIVEEAQEVGLPVAGHIPLQIPALEAARAGQRTNEHLFQIREACSTIEVRLIEERRRFYAGSYTEADENAMLDSDVHRMVDAFDEGVCRVVARSLAEMGQWQVPTLVNERRWFLGVPRDRLDDPRLAYIPPEQRESWRRRLETGSVTYAGDSASLRRGWETTLRVVRLLGDAGAGIMVGTDFGQPFVLPGFAVHEEMALLVQAGLSPLKALQAATIQPARYLEATDSLGTVAPGRLADLILLEANPLEDIRNTQRISAVVLNGRYLDRPALDALLNEPGTEARNAGRGTPFTITPDAEGEVADDVADPQIASVTVNGIELHYVEQGEGDPVVLIHGSLADYTYWELSDQISLLSGGHRVIAYSRRYNYPNRNPRRDDHSPVVEAQDLAAFLEALDIGPAHIVGHSYGAYTALVFALDHPERVRSLVLAEPPIISWLPEIPGGEGIFEGFMERVWQPLGEAFQQGTDAGLDFTARWYFRAPFDEIEPEWQALFSRNAEEWHALAVSEHTFPKLDYDRVRALQVPTLLLSGGGNQGFNPLVDGHLERLLPRAVRVVIPDASHEMFLDDREASAAALLDFFERH